MNLRSAGAKGDGVTDDTAALARAVAAMTAVGDTSLIIPSGRYLIDPTVIDLSSLDVIGVGKPEILPRSTSTTANLLTFRGRKITVRGVRFIGRKWEALGDPVWPATLLRFESSPVSDGVSDCLVEECYFEGGDTGVCFRNVSRSTAKGCHFFRQYTNALGCLDGQTACVFERNIFREAGIGNAIRIGDTAGVSGVKTVAMDFNIVEGCGVLNPASMQEAFDCASDAAQYVYLRGNQVTGGIGLAELKTRAGTFSPLVYARFIIAGNTLETAHNCFGVALHWTSPYPATPDLARNVTMRDNLMVCTATTTTNSGAFVLYGYTDVDVSGNDVDGFHIGVNLNGGGSSDGTVRRPRIAGNRMRNVEIGIYGGGTVEDGLITGNDIVARSFAIQHFGVSSGLQIVANPRLHATATGSCAVQVRTATSTRIERNRMCSHGHCIHDVGGAGSGTGNRAMWNDLHSVAADGAYLNGGAASAWEFAHNSIVKPSGSRGHIAASGTITAYANDCGAAAAAPATAGAVGDVVRAVPPAAGLQAWAVSVAGSPATWVQV